jgi:hypothetical protein
MNAISLPKSPGKQLKTILKFILARPGNVRDWD